MYKFEDFLKGKFSIYCNNESDKIILLQKLDDLGIRWASNQKASNFGRAMIFDGYGYVIHNGKLKFDCGNSNAVKFKDVDFGGNNMFTKDNLETGMRVVVRDGNEYVVMKDYETVHYGVGAILGVNGIGFKSLKNYNHDLTHATLGKDSDIMKVLKPIYDSDVLSNNEDDFEVIWEREEAVELTVAQISEKLGYKVKVVE